jgi:phage terminase large subunit-like protein
MIAPTIAKARARASKAGWNPKRILTELDARAVLDHGCYYDPGAALRVERFFDRLLHTTDGEWAGKPFILQDWQRHQFIQPLFGWKRADGTRRYRRGGVWVPKKNGKSTLLAGVELYLLIADREPSAEVYSAANDRAQAGIIYAQAARMVELSPKLYARIGEKGIIRSTKTLYDRASGSTFKALSSDAPTKEGLNTHGLIVDEIHAMRSRVLWDALIYGGAARRQPLVLSISTAGVYDIATIGWEQYTYARDIVNGTNSTDWSFYALIYEAASAAPWTRETTWRKANPSYGVTVKIDALREECAEAKAQPQKENAFRRYRLNQWVQQVTRWIPMSTWAANAGHPIDRVALAGRVAYGGLDLDVLMRFWVPEAALKPRSDSGDRKDNRNAPLYQQWAREGLLELTPGNVTDYDFVEARILEDAQTYAIHAIGLDRFFQGQAVSNHLSDRGITIVAVGQGFLSQGPPMKEFERRWKAKRIHHGNHPILTWNADNVEVAQDPMGNLKIVKPHNHMDPRKVDGIAALVNAMDQVSRASAPAPEYQIHFLGPARSGVTLAR